MDWVDLHGAIPVQLDITDPESVRRAAEFASVVNVLVNNAGVSTQSTLLDGSIDDIRLEMETCTRRPAVRTRRPRPRRGP